MPEPWDRAQKSISKTTKSKVIISVYLCGISYKTNICREQVPRPISKGDWSVWWDHQDTIHINVTYICVCFFCLRFLWIITKLSHYPTQIIHNNHPGSPPRVPTNTSKKGKLHSSSIARPKGRVVNVKGPSDYGLLYIIVLLYYSSAHLCQLHR